MYTCVLDSFLNLTLCLGFRGSKKICFTEELKHVHTLLQGTFTIYKEPVPSSTPITCRAKYYSVNRSFIKVMGIIFIYLDHLRYFRIFLMLARDSDCFKWKFTFWWLKYCIIIEWWMQPIFAYNIDYRWYYQSLLLVRQLYKYLL
jgi:hypothetical protein